MERRIGKLLVRLVEGDITHSDVDAVVNAANNHLWMGAGVAGAIRRAGGKVIEEEAVKQGPIPVGSSVITTGGDLKARHVIHAAVMGQDLVTNAELIRKATRSAIELAKEKGLKSIAFPALGTGVGGFPLSEAARIMFLEIASFAEEPGLLELVVLALYGQAAFDSFAAELARL